jgi:hypothetical protein
MKRHIDIDTRIDLEGPIDDVIVRLQNIQEKYKDHAGVRIEVDSCYEGGYTYYLERLETDEEYERRLATEAKRVIERESIRRVAYERLKAEFEK